MDLMIAGLTARRTTKDVNVAAARDNTNKGFSFTRRIIALVSVISIVAVPILASVYLPDFTLSYGWFENKGGFWFFSDAKDVMKYTLLEGMTILPFHTHLLAAITGLYFGKDVAK